MAALQDIWQLEPDGGLTAEIGDFRLLVSRPADAGSIGTEPDVRSAMQTASRMAGRLTTYSS
jgi:hypothetical protein